VAWVGFDDDRDMGGREQGGVTAIPMWIGFMEEALRNQPESELGRPPGIVELRINPASGLVASDANRNAIWEKFRVDNVPEREPDPSFSLLPGERTPDDRSSTDAAIF
jgi:penicillin-binding protein 1A